MKLCARKINSPVGELTLIANPNALIAILWATERPGRVKLEHYEFNNPDHPILVRAAVQLNEYFSGHRQAFDLPLAPSGTEFQKRVWRALRKIPFGETQSYAELARSIGTPQAARAVGAANGRNPLSIVVPCHRVIGASGKLTGFAGGLESKETLLNLEKAGTVKFTSLPPRP